MTREDILRMARDSGMELYGLGKNRDKFLFYLERFADLVAASEREACAQVVEQAGIDGYGTLAAAVRVRARGENR